MKTLKFKLYTHKRNRHLKRTINAAGVIYNHCIALHKRYYRMFGKHLNCAKLQSHIAKLRKRNSFWQSIGSQAMQDICQRIKNLVRKHEDISHRRRDWFWKLAHELTDKFDVLCFETLNLKGMQRLWGKKISDLAFGEFLQILEWVAKKKHKQVVFVDQWYPSTKTCSNCEHVLEKIDLSIREWRCPSCQSVNGRDENAARNIQMVGASTIGLGDVNRAVPAIAV